MDAKPCGCCKSDDEPVSDGLGAAVGRVNPVVVGASPAAFLPDLSEVKDSTEEEELPLLGRDCGQGCQMAKFDPFPTLDCARVEGVGRNPRKGRDQILQRSVAEP